MFGFGTIRTELRNLWHKVFDHSVRITALENIAGIDIKLNWQQVELFERINSRLDKLEKKKRR